MEELAFRRAARPRVFAKGLSPGRWSADLFSLSAAIAA